jgi:hypothetical protein
MLLCCNFLSLFLGVFVDMPQSILYARAVVLLLVRFSKINRTTSVTPSVLPHKTTYKTIHEHHIYLILHVIYCVDKVL